MYKDIYAIKDCPCVTLTNSEREKLEINWSSKVHVIKREGYNAVILEGQLTSNNVDDFLKSFTTLLGTIDLKFRARLYNTGEYIAIEKCFTNMKFIKELVGYDYDEVSSFIWVFCDDYNYMRDEIEDCIKTILAEPQKSTVDFRLNDISKNLEKVNDVFENLTHTLKDIERAILKQPMSKKTIINNEFVNTLTQDYLDAMAEEIKRDKKLK